MMSKMVTRFLELGGFPVLARFSPMGESDNGAHWKLLVVSAHYDSLGAGG